MKYLLTLFLLLLAALRLSAQQGTTDNLSDDPFFFAAAIEFPIFALATGGPRVGIAGVSEEATWEAFPLEMVVGFGLAGTWGYYLTGDRRLRSAVTLGFRRQPGSSIFQYRSGEGTSSATEAVGWMDHAVNTVRLGGELQVQPIQWGKRGSYLGENSTKVERRSGITLRLGAFGLWRTGSELRAMTHPDNITPSPVYIHEPEPYVYYDGPIPDLETWGAELVGGLGVEVPLSDRLTGSISLSLSTSLTDLTPGDWSYRTLGLDGRVVW